MIFNNVSGGVCSTAMALLYPKIPCIVVNTGANYPEAWRAIKQLQDRGHKIIVLSSFIGGYPTYYEYIKGEELIPFIVSCSYKAKQSHLNKFYNAIGPVTVNVGITADEEQRTAAFTDSKMIKYNFPLVTHGYTREMCETILDKYGVKARKSGCWFCGKQPKKSWAWLFENHPDLYNEAIEMGWTP